MTKEEQQILGRALLLGKYPENAVGLNSPDALKIFNAMQYLKSRGLPLDHVTLGNQLKVRGQLEEIGGAIALADLTDSV